VSESVSQWGEGVVRERVGAPHSVSLRTRQRPRKPHHKKTTAIQQMKITHFFL